jgi:hypothetical protein
MCALPLESIAIDGSLELPEASVSRISLDHVVAAAAGAAVIMQSIVSSVTANNAFDLIVFLFILSLPL